MSGKLVLGVDPGYANVGLSVLRKVKGSPPELVFSRCLSAGNAGNLASFLGVTRKALSQIHEVYPFTEWATEILPVLDNLNTTLNIRFASGMLWDAAHELTGHAPRLVSAQTVKSCATRILDIPNKKDVYVTKGQVGEAVHRVLGQNSLTHHENDASLVALSAFFPTWITKQPAGISSPSKRSRKVSVRA